MALPPHQPFAVCVGNILTFYITYVPQCDSRLRGPLGPSLIGIGRSLFAQLLRTMALGMGQGLDLGRSNCKFTSQASIKYRITTCLMSICLGPALTASYSFDCSAVRPFGCLAVICTWSKLASGFELLTLLLVLPHANGMSLSLAIWQRCQLSLSAHCACQKSHNYPTN